MNRIILSVATVLITTFSLVADAAVKPVSGGYRVDYHVSIPRGTSNGSDIQDVMIFEWNAAGDLSVEGGFSIKARGHTKLSHVIGFEPDSALVFGWGAAVPGVGDEKDHLFTLMSSSETRRVTGKKWSIAYPGVAPVPRTGHSAMIGLLRDASAGDSAALGALTDFVQREATAAAFDPDKHFRLVEWTIAQPIDTSLPVPGLSFYGILLLILGFAALSQGSVRARVSSAVRR